MRSDCNIRTTAMSARRLVLQLIVIQDILIRRMLVHIEKMYFKEFELHLNLNMARIRICNDGGDGGARNPSKVK